MQQTDCRLPEDVQQISRGTILKGFLQDWYSYLKKKKGERKKETWDFPVSASLYLKKKSQRNTMYEIQPCKQKARSAVAHTHTHGFHTNKR